MLDHTLWHWTSPVWLVAAAIGAIYVISLGAARWRRLPVLVLALVLLVLAFVSPIGVLADGYLFSAHMVQHLLLLLVVPMCLLLCVPKQTAQSWFKRPRLDRIGRLMAIALIGWIAGVGAMWFWHVPTLCSTATQNPWIGALRDASFLLAGLIFWWPIYSPVDRYRLPPLTGITYLFSACLGCTLLGIYITFTTISVCPAFANPGHQIAIVNRLYDAGLTPSVDQHLGGLLMWVPPCTLYVSAIVSLLCRWYSAMDEAVLPQHAGDVALELPTTIGQLSGNAK